jgi:hypothetical protein
VIIPAKYEACYFCGLFRKVKGLLRSTKSVDEKEVWMEVLKRRKETEEETLGEVKDGDIVVFNHDAKFKDFYLTQPQKLEWR